MSVETDLVERCVGIRKHARAHIINNKIKVNRGGGSRGDSEIGTKGGILRSGVDLSWIW